jgi:hypothetical protein
MAVELTQAYIATIQPDHTVAVPEEMPIGASVAVIVLPSQPADDAARRARFTATLAAIQSAMSTPVPPLTDSELNALLEKARRSQIP